MVLVKAGDQVAADAFARGLSLIVAQTVRDKPQIRLQMLDRPGFGQELEKPFRSVVTVVTDAAATREALLAKGYEPGPIKEFKRDDELLARFFFIQDPDGYKIEMLERYGHYQ